MIQIKCTSKSKSDFAGPEIYSWIVDLRKSLLHQDSETQIWKENIDEKNYNLSMIRMLLKSTSTDSAHLLSS
jgi:hypothetical protein